MLKQILEFRSDYNKIPSDEDLMICIKVQKNNPDKIVILNWTMKWTGNFEISFEDVNTLEEARKKLPKRYVM